MFLHLVIEYISTNLKVGSIDHGIRPTPNKILKNANFKYQRFLALSTWVD